jgi:hypothetical protein
MRSSARHAARTGRKLRAPAELEGIGAAVAPADCRFRRIYCPPKADDHRCCTLPLRSHREGSAGGTALRQIPDVSGAVCSQLNAAARPPVGTGSSGSGPAEAQVQAGGDQQDVAANGSRAAQSGSGTVDRGTGPGREHTGHSARPEERSRFSGGEFRRQARTAVTDQGAPADPGRQWREVRRGCQQVGRAIKEACGGDVSAGLFWAAGDYSAAVGTRRGTT